MLLISLLFIYFYSFKSLSVKQSAGENSSLGARNGQFYCLRSLQYLKRRILLKHKGIVFQHDKIEPIAASMTIC